MKKLLTLILALALSLCACFSLVACGDDLTGFDIDLSREVVNYLNDKYDQDIDIEFLEIDWNSKEALLADKSIDLVWNGLTVTESRTKEMCISMPYLYNNQVAVINKADSNKYTTKDSFKEAIIACENGSSGDDFLTSSNLGKETVRVDSQLDAMVQLAKGDFDAIVIDSVMAGYYCASKEYKDKLMVVDNLILAEEVYGIATKKGNDALMNKINEALVALKDSKYSSLINEYGLTASKMDLKAENNNYANATDSSWTEVCNSKKLIIGYTVYAPIAFS